MPVADFRTNRSRRTINKPGRKKQPGPHFHTIRIKNNLETSLLDQPDRLCREQLLIVRAVKCTTGMPDPLWVTLATRIAEVGARLTRG